MAGSFLMMLARIHSSLQDRAPQSEESRSERELILKVFQRLTGVVDDLQLFDVTQDLDTGKSPNDIHTRRSPTSIANDKRLVFRQVEKVIGAASGVAAADDPYARPGANNEILLVPDVLSIMPIGCLEIIGLKSLELRVP
jgi:hypothetical protein